MKDKKLIILYIIMLIIGFALLFNNSTTTAPVEEKKEIVQVAAPILPKTVKMTVAMAKNDIEKSKIINTSDYYFETIELNESDYNLADYVTNPTQINSYVAKNNITQGSIISPNFIAAPNSIDYISLALKPGQYIFPMDITANDNYLLNNLKSGDLIDIYILYGQNNTEITSPSHNFASTKIKPIIVGKQILFINDGNSAALNLKNKSQLPQINIALSHDEIKLVRTLMTNAKIMLYPSQSSINDMGISVLGDREKGWPMSEQEILNQAQIIRLKGK